MRIVKGESVRLYHSSHYVSTYFHATFIGESASDLDLLFFFGCQGNIISARPTLVRIQEKPPNYEIRVVVCDITTKG